MQDFRHDGTYIYHKGEIAMDVSNIGSRFTRLDTHRVVDRALELYEENYDQLCLTHLGINIEHVILYSEIIDDKRNYYFPLNHVLGVREYDKHTYNKKIYSRLRISEGSAGGFVAVPPTKREKIKKIEPIVNNFDPHTRELGFDILCGYLYD